MMVLNLLLLQEYIGFVKCMNALKGMKMCYKDRDTVKAWTANIKVTSLSSSYESFFLNDRVVCSNFRDPAAAITSDTLP